MKANQGVPVPGVTWRVDIPCHTARTNELIGVHWATKARRRRADDQLVAVSAHNAGTPRATCKRRVRVVVVLGPRQRGADPDAHLKSLADALVACGLLVDDSKEWVEWEPVEYTRGRFRSMHVYLTEIPS